MDVLCSDIPPQSTAYTTFLGAIYLQLSLVKNKTNIGK